MEGLMKVKSLLVSFLNCRMQSHLTLPLILFNLISVLFSSSVTPVPALERLENGQQSGAGEEENPEEEK
jgi:hypothetical protein